MHSCTECGLGFKKGALCEVCGLCENCCECD